MSIPMQHAVVQGLVALSVAFLILALGDRKRGGSFSVLSLLSATALYFFNARFLGWPIVVACLPIFAVAFVLAVVSNAGHLMPQKERQWIESVLARANSY